MGLQKCWKAPNESWTTSCRHYCRHFIDCCMHVTENTQHCCLHACQPKKRNGGKVQTLSKNFFCSERPTSFCLVIKECIEPWLLYTFACICSLSPSPMGCCVFSQTPFPEKQWSWVSLIEVEFLSVRLSHPHFPHLWKSEESLKYNHHSLATGLAAVTGIAEWYQPQLGLCGCLGCLHQCPRHPVPAAPCFFPANIPPKHFLSTAKVSTSWVLANVSQTVTLQSFLSELTPGD